MTEFSTRSSTTKPLIGQSQSNVPPGQLPSEGDILRLLANYREKPKCNKKGVLAFCCPNNRDKEAICQLQGGCAEKPEHEQCILYKVKITWLKAGILTVSDSRIKEKIVSLSESYNKIFRHRNVMTDTVKKHREEYIKGLQKTFDIKDPKARQMIVDDPLRSEKDKEEDLSYFDDYLEPNSTRRWILDKHDDHYKELVEESMECEKEEKKERKGFRIE